MKPTGARDSARDRRGHVWPWPAECLGWSFPFGQHFTPRAAAGDAAGSINLRDGTTMCDGRQLVKFEAAIEVLPKVYSEEAGPGGIMRILPAVIIVPVGNAQRSGALKLIETDIHPVDKKPWQ